MSTGINQDAFSGDTPPPEKSLIPKAMLGDGIQGEEYGSLNAMQQVIGLTPEQAQFRLQQQELTLKQQELNQRFLFRLLMTVGSITGAVILGALAIFQFSPGNRANAYAQVAERTAESIGRPEIRVDCGFRLMGECDAGQMADQALTRYEQPTSIKQSQPRPEAVHVPLPPIPAPRETAGAVMAAMAPTQRTSARPVTDPRQTADYRQARDIIHRWSQRGFGSEEIAGHYYWLEQVQSNPSDPNHVKALQQPKYKLFGLAYEDYYNLSI